MTDAQCPDAFIEETISLDKQLRFLDNKIKDMEGQLEMLKSCQLTIGSDRNKRVEHIREGGIGAKYRSALYHAGLMKGL